MKSDRDYILIDDATIRSGDDYGKIGEKQWRCVCGKVFPAPQNVIVQGLVELGTEKTCPKCKKVYKIIKESDDSPP